MSQGSTLTITMNYEDNKIEEINNRMSAKQLPLGSQMKGRKKSTGSKYKVPKEQLTMKMMIDKMRTSKIQNDAKFYEVAKSSTHNSLPEKQNDYKM